jgi:cadmium resistance transport/sequestration family protein
LQKSAYYKQEKVISMELIISSIVAFASTNIDDIFVLMLFFGNKRYQSREVIIGQYLGIITLVAISVIGSLAGLLIDPKYIGLLGLLPVFLGIKSLVRLNRGRRTAKEDEIEKPPGSNKHGNILSVAAVTIANGGDNIGIYIPLFATLSFSGKAIMIAIFMVMVAIWCWTGRYLSKHRLLASTISKYGHIATPVVLILLGIYILYESGNLGFLFP